MPMSIASTSMAGTRASDHFSEYTRAGDEPDNMEKLYKKVHAAIRANPNPARNVRQPPAEYTRKQRLIMRLNALNDAAEANDDDSDEDDE
ncbi:60S ribosomal protein L5-like protein [Tanacetum coccineum]